MTEEMKYYTGNCITDLHTDTYNKEKCKQYIKLGGLNFCMSSVCPEKDCIYALVYKLHQKIDRLEQENRELKAYKDVNEDFKKAWDELNKKYTEVLKLAKTNADSNEYCLQELEKENKELKETNKYQKKAIRLYDCIDKWGTKECHCACRCLGNEFCEDADKKINTYRSALEEIREIIVINKDELEHCLYHDYDEQILSKINEVLNESK